MSDTQDPKPQNDRQPSASQVTRTKHGLWTPEVSRAAEQEVRDLAQDSAAPEPGREDKDKSDLNLPQERRPIDH